MAAWRFPRKIGCAAILTATFGLALDVAPAVAQPPPSNPSQMCGTGETFSVNLPGASLGIDDSRGFWRNIEVPDANDDVVTLPKGCRIYAFLISGFGDNADYDRIIFYKVAEFVAQNNGYVHVGWWNNLTAPYMERPLHNQAITIQKYIPILGIPIGDPVHIFPTPKTEGVPDTFVNTNLDLPKANPDEDFQFLSDAREVLKAVRTHNPHALIIVVGHSMGGNAVARLGATPGVPIDLLAPIDPVGNRDTPRADFGDKKFNWTRWRAAVNFRGYKQWDCVRNSAGFCADTDFNPFTITFACTTSTTPWLPDMPLIGSRAPIICPRAPYVDPGIRLTIGTNVKYLYHRWQHEFVWPVDFGVTERFNRPAAFPLSTTNILSKNYQAAVPQQLLLPDPNRTCHVGIDPRDSRFLCNATDGHGEIVGVRANILGSRERPGLQLQDWPPRSEQITFPPAERRARLVQLAVDGADWPYRPQNPDLCLVCDDIIAITQHLMSQQTWETEEEEDTVSPESHATQVPDANAGGWVNEDTVVSVSATDDRSGVEQISVTLSGAQAGNTITPGSSAQVTIDAEGLTTVSYFASDDAGNAEAPHTLEVRIDKTPPEIAALTDIPANASGWHRSPVVVSFPATDNPGGSGLAASSPDVTISTEGGAQEVVGEAEDIAGNVSTASVTLSIDTTAPAIALASRTPANGAGWNNTDVALTWNCSDALSGPTVDQVSQSLSAEGVSQSATANCADRADNISSDTQSGINIDKTSPSSHITTPSDGAIYALNAAVNAAYGCSDVLSGISACAGPVSSGVVLDTSTVGTRTFTVNAMDLAGNSNAVSHSYSIHYEFSGFKNPITPMPAVNKANAGRTVPVKYSLYDATGAVISDLSSFVSLMSVPVACDTNVPTADAEETDAAGSTTIRFDAGEFLFNWKTSATWAGTCRALQLTLNDGTQHMVAFEFR